MLLVLVIKSSRARRTKGRQMRGDFGGREANIFKPPAE